MSQILNQNTVWHAGAPIVLTDDVQIVPGVTLTIEAGAIVKGRSIQTFGAGSAASEADRNSCHCWASFSHAVAIRSITSLSLSTVAASANLRHARALLHSSIGSLMRGPAFEHL